MGGEPRCREYRQRPASQSYPHREPAPPRPLSPSQPAPLTTPTAAAPTHTIPPSATIPTPRSSTPYPQKFLRILLFIAFLKAREGIRDRIRKRMRRDDAAALVPLLAPHGLQQLRKLITQIPFTPPSARAHRARKGARYTSTTGPKASSLAARLVLGPELCGGGGGGGTDGVRSRSARERKNSRSGRVCRSAWITALL